MARYNPKNKQHRKSLATRIAKMLVAAGFSLDASSKGEAVYERPVDGTTARVRVLTSIINGEVRIKDADAIRVCAVLDTNGSTRGLVKSTRINRTGETDGITARLLTAMRKTYKTAQKRANDPGFLALPQQPAKKRWVPKAKKAAYKAKKSAAPAKKQASAATLNEARSLAAALKTFKVGMLVKSSPTPASRDQLDATPLRGMVKAINRGAIDVFWFHSGQTLTHPPTQIKPLVAE